MNTITFGQWEGCFLVIFIHTIKNSGGYFYQGRLFLWILDINLKNFVRGYFSKFSVRALLLGISRIYETICYGKSGELKTVCQFFDFCLKDFRNYLALQASVISW